MHVCGLKRDKLRVVSLRTGLPTKYTHQYARALSSSPGTLRRTDTQTLIPRTAVV